MCSSKLARDMALPPTLASTSPLDRAHAARLNGDLDGALRLATALLEHDTAQLGAAALITTTLVAEDRGMIAGEAALRLVDAFIRRGDLPQALVAARTAARAGDDAEPLFATIAAAFGKGSKRVADVSASPPPLPDDVEVPKALAAVKGEALLARAEAAIEKWLATDDPLVVGHELADDCAIQRNRPDLGIAGEQVSIRFPELLPADQIGAFCQGTGADVLGEAGNEALEIMPVKGLELGFDWICRIGHWSVSWAREVGWWLLKESMR